MVIFFRTVFKPFLKTVYDMGQQLMIREANFLIWMASFNPKMYRVCECIHMISKTLKRKNHMLKDHESEGDRYCHQREKWGAQGTWSN